MEFGEQGECGENGELKTNAMIIGKNSNLTPAICRIFLAPVDDVSSITPIPDRFHRHLAFKYRIPEPTELSWKEIYFTAGTAEFSEKSKDTDSGELIEQSLKFIFPGEDESNLTALDLIACRPVLVKVQYSTSMSKLIGDLDNGAKLSQVTQVSNKISGSQLEFTCLATYRSCWITP